MVDAFVAQTGTDKNVFMPFIFSSAEPVLYTKIVSTYVLFTKYSYDIFFNSVGPIPPTKGEIFIDCQPTGDDGEVIMPVKPSSGGIIDNQTMQKLINNNMVKILIGALIMIGIWKLSMKIINGIAGHSAKVSAVPRGPAAPAATPAAK